MYLQKNGIIRDDGSTSWIIFSMDCLRLRSSDTTNLVTLRASLIGRNLQHANGLLVSVLKIFTLKLNCPIVNDIPQETYDDDYITSYDIARVD